MESTHTLQDDKSLEILSFVNMVHHYREELGQVIEGSLAQDVLSERDRTILKRHGIISVREGGREGRGYVVDWPVKALLERLK